MKIKGFEFPQSSFLIIEKDMETLVDLILSNERLKKLLYYTTPDCLSRPNVSPDVALEMLGKNIKIVPKMQIDGEVLNYIIIRFDSFTQSGNPEFRDSLLEFDIVCHFNQWHLKDFSLRPYKIAGELDSMLNHKNLSNLGKLEFFGAGQTVFTDEFGGLNLMYSAVHGVEDKIDALNPTENKDIINNFNKIFN